MHARDLEGVVPASGGGPDAGSNDVVRVTADCWACDGAVTKWVPRRNRHHHYFHWTCERCSVTWCGPARAA